MADQEMRSQLVNGEDGLRLVGRPVEDLCDEVAEEQPGRPLSERRVGPAPKLAETLAQSVTDLVFFARVEPYSASQQPLALPGRKVTDLHEPRRRDDPGQGLGKQFGIADGLERRSEVPRALRRRGVGQQFVAVGIVPDEAEKDTERLTGRHRAAGGLALDLHRTASTSIDIEHVEVNGVAARGVGCRPLNSHAAHGRVVDDVQQGFQGPPILVAEPVGGYPASIHSYPPLRSMPPCSGSRRASGVADMSAARRGKSSSTRLKSR
ncbi:hypothetical protein AB0M46_24145 [Dactylosporangium sp. NPDC051485]|uniref:hypothetical protein n=1 Tax=Dactylosporangium sp. NPDC051485 TaxID=3154846 RepID=UPI0034172D6E